MFNQHHYQHPIAGRVMSWTSFQLARLGETRKETIFQPREGELLSPAILAGAS